MRPYRFFCLSHVSLHNIFDDREHTLRPSSSLVSLSHILMDPDGVATTNPGWVSVHRRTMRPAFLSLGPPPDPSTATADKTRTSTLTVDLTTLLSPALPSDSLNRLARNIADAGTMAEVQSPCRVTERGLDTTSCTIFTCGLSRCVHVKP